MPDEISIGAAHSLFNAYNGHDKQEFLLFISSAENLSLKAVNYRCMQYFRNYFPLEEGEEDFFKEKIHPEDYLSFLHLLGNYSEELETGESSGIIRMKSTFGYWKKFHLESRFYGGFNEESENFVLTLAKPVENIRAQGRKEHKIETESVLRESLNHYRVLVNSLDQGFGVVEMIFDLQKKPIDYLFVEVNPAFEKHTGLRDPLGKTMREFYKKHENPWFNTLGRVAFTGEAVRFEDYAAARNRWFDVYAFPIGSKKSRKVACLFSDITRRKETEEKLRRLNDDLELKVKSRTYELEENNELLQMVFDTVNQGIFVMKPLFGENYDIVDFTYIRVNKVINRYYNQNRMVGRSFLEHNPQSTEKGVFETLKQTMLTGESADFEIEVERNEKNNWFRITSRRQSGLLVCSLENITRDKLKAQKLKENVKFKKQLIDTSPDIIMTFDLYNEKVKFINRDLSEEEGMTVKQVEGMHLLDILPLIHPQDRRKTLSFHTDLMEASDEDVVEVEFRLKGKEKHWDYYNARGKVFKRNRKFNVVEYILLLRNVQSQKMTQQALITAEKLSIKGEIARTLAHELRNPLASISMSADILEKINTGSRKKLLKNYTGIIKRSATTLNNLVTDLLTASNYSKPQMTKCCLARTTNKALSHAKDRIYLSGVTVHKKYRGPYFINADEEKLQIAILNIIVNASEAMVPHEGVLNISIKKKKNNYALTITDNGCGMEQKQLDRLFESFYTQKPGGMGIGLSSVKNILDDHGATIEVQSVPREGTSFVLTFPCHEDVIEGK
ncbi:ATP-binding protein [Salinimicrobium sediminilitoris]|uniref:ATP-binding protein n=1 Tax=Salinimicrobium sediminilitoris TaxID=2876715 RepID=UPI001E4E09CD|nr:ATP-binding protein [Salinimicrobium sediminilitoris]MCC8358858.1 PAS domain S-box protein [Salinimicrobium sediminilitoris]